MVNFYIKLFLFRKYFILILYFFFSVSFSSNTLLANDNFNDWLLKFKVEASEKGISKQTINLLNDLKPNKKTIKLDRNQPEFKLTFDNYFSKVVSEYRIKNAKIKLKENQKILNHISNKYNVQSRFIISLWGIESNFGNNMGDFNILQSLITLSYDGRRSQYFRKELIAALKILDRKDIHPNDFKGSWAGAMGQCQFMPSTYLKFAKDGDNDGKIDIWNNKKDVFASIANYLKNVGWNDNYTWGRKVKVPNNFSIKNYHKKRKLLLEWSKLGLRKIDGSSLPHNNIYAKFISIDKEKDMSFVVYNNFESLLKWNRSNYFALSVSLLSDKLIY